MGTYDKDHPYRPNDSRTSSRELTRTQKMDPGEDLEDSSTCVPPTLEAMTHKMDHPVIGDVGTPPERVLSTDSSAAAAAAMAKGRADFARASEKLDRAVATNLRR